LKRKFFLKVSPLGFRAVATEKLAATSTPMTGELQNRDIKTHPFKESKSNYMRH